MHTSAVGLSQSPSAIDLFVPKTAAKKSANGATANATSTTSTGTGLDGTTTGTTFLSLLVDELQNQDPSAPMDSTQMVGQMISLNQLDQLVSINSELGTSTATTPTTPTPPTPPTPPTNPAHGVSSAANSGTQSSAQLVAARNALLSDSSLASQVNPANLAVTNPNMTLDLSSLTNQFGGK